MKDDSYPSLFSMEELCDCMAAEAPSGRDMWEDRKKRLGCLRVDITKTLKSDESGFPVIEPYWGIPENGLIDFKEAISSTDYYHWVHFFVDDVEFERLWNSSHTERYLTKLEHFAGCFSPDFTVSPDMQPWQEQFNIARGRAIGQILQSRGVNVIATVGWSTRRSFDYSFAGLSEGGTVAISTNGVLKQTASVRLFREGVFEMERRLRPENIILVGQELSLNTKARQIWYPNERIRHLRTLNR